MAKIIFEDNEGDRVEIVRNDFGDTYDDFANLIYSLSLGLGYSEKVVDRYISCEFNNYSLDNRGID